MSIKANLFYDIAADEIVGLQQLNENKQYLPANNVFTIMARGIFHNWKQPIGYVFVKSSCDAANVKKLIFQTIRELYNINLKVRAVITDVGSNFVNFTNILKVSENNPYFFVDQYKIFYIFDICHLLKALRNNFLKYRFKDKNGNIIHHKYVIEFYERDKKRNYRLAPKLTDAHVRPQAFQKMKVKLASQLFSRHVANGMATEIEVKSLPEEATSTMIFIHNMNNLFDLLNSSKKTSFEKEIFKNMFRGEDYQLNLLNKMLIFFKTVQVLNSVNREVTNTIKSLHCWRITIKSTILLQKELNKSICTRRLNQDCLENFFGAVRQQGGNCFNPTPVQFKRAFKKLFSMQFLQHSEGANSCNDFASMLVAIESKERNQCQIINSILSRTTSAHKSVEVDTTDYRHLDMGEQNSLSYVCGYLIKKCLMKHTCDTCSNFAVACKVLTDDKLLCHFNAFDDDAPFGNLKMPDEAFIFYIATLEKQFASLFSINSILPSCGQNIKAALAAVPIPHPCEQFPHDYLLSLFVRMRIFYSIKLINKQLLSAPKRNRKLAILTHL
ncbi:hypothetical protein Zmor_015123 [Zophobas morio]|uniref:THAP domain-containing protein 9 n=1 Tax=Zophobas morio TaxID=2755281 RepID=A0AA38MHA7_9CUCU|nr:hypothetical protein Zmor_015123 [Zophobas morio]